MWAVPSSSTHAVERRSAPSSYDGGNEQFPRLLRHVPLTQKPQSQSPSLLQVSSVQPWLTGTAGAVQRVFVGHVQPSSQGIGSQPFPSAAALSTAQRWVSLQVKPSEQRTGTQIPASGSQRAPDPQLELGVQGGAGITQVP